MFYNRFYQQQQNTPATEFFTGPKKVTEESFAVKVFIQGQCQQKKKKVMKKKASCKRITTTEIRRFRTQAGVSLETLMSEIQRIARLSMRDLKITALRYRDEDKDLISCDSEEEWKEALNCCSAMTTVVIEIDVEPVITEQQQQQAEVPTIVEEKKEEVVEEPKQPQIVEQPTIVEEKKEEPKCVEQQPTPVQKKSIHRGIKCDGCDKVGIEGIRYKCSACPDFDLCEKCFERRSSEPINHSAHVFVPIESPIPAAQFIVPDPQPVVIPEVEQPKKEEPKPVVVEAKQEELDPHMAQALGVLSSMGFSNKELCVFLLKKHKNNVARVVDEYLKI